MSICFSCYCYSFRYHPPSSLFFFFNDTATTEIYTLSLHDALPIYFKSRLGAVLWLTELPARRSLWRRRHLDRKSTRLNSSHSQISYAVFCLKKKKQHTETYRVASNYIMLNQQPTPLTTSSVVVRYI